MDRSEQTVAKSHPSTIYGVRSVADEDRPHSLGADDRTRTGDLLITNQLLYQLSYIGLSGGASHGTALSNSKAADYIRGSAGMLDCASDAPLAQLDRAADFGFSPVARPTNHAVRASCFQQLSLSD